MGANASSEPSTAFDRDTRAAAFTALYDAHVVTVYRYVHRRCQDVTIAEDVTQDTFVAAVRSVSDPAEITIAWLLRVARNRLTDVLRRQSRYAEKLRLVGSGVGDQLDIAGDSVDAVTIARAMQALSVDHRLVLTLHYLDGYTVPELARELGRTVKAGERLVERALSNLRRELGGHDA